MPEQRNFNKMALQGWNVDDMEIVEQFNLDPALAYTPQLNDVMIEKMYQENYRGHINNGLSEQEAASKAGKLKDQVTQEISDLLG